MEVNIKPILLRDAEAIKLVEERALRERRKKNNAAAVTIIEHLSPGEDTKKEGPASGSLKENS